MSAAPLMRPPPRRPLAALDPRHRPAAVVRVQLGRAQRRGVDPPERVDRRSERVDQRGLDHAPVGDREQRPSAAACASSQAATRAANARRLSPPCGAASGSVIQAPATPGSSACTEARVRPAQAPKSHSAIARLDQRRAQAAAAAVSRQRRAGLDTTSHARAGPRRPQRRDRPRRAGRPRAGRRSRAWRRSTRAGRAAGASCGQSIPDHLRTSSGSSVPNLGVVRRASS